MKLLIQITISLSFFLNVLLLLAESSDESSSKKSSPTETIKFNENNTADKSEKNILVISSQKETIQETVLGMNVSGNKEAPNLLYIIPWKDNQQQARPLELYRLMDEVYSTLDPEVFIKEVSYFEKINASNVESNPFKTEIKE